MMQKPMNDFDKYLEMVKSEVPDVKAEDFEDIEATIPAEGEDGEEIAMLLTGTIKDGVLTEIKSTRLFGDTEEKDEPKEGLKKIFKGDNADEE